MLVHFRNCSLSNCCQWKWMQTGQPGLMVHDIVALTAPKYHWCLQNMVRFGRTQITPTQKSATARLPRKKFVTVLNFFRFMKTTITSKFPKSKCIIKSYPSLQPWKYADTCASRMHLKCMGCSGLTVAVDVTDSAYATRFTSYWSGFKCPNGTFWLTTCNVLFVSLF